MEDIVTDIDNGIAAPTGDGSLRMPLVWLLLWSGVGIVVFSATLGQLCVTHPYSNNGYQWNHDDANQAATVLRCLGGMLFAAGLIERLILVLRAEERSPH